MRSGLKELRDWLTSQGITHVAMEGTGIYWMPVYTMLEGYLDAAVVNARHVSKVPGRKTDVSDAAWLAELLRKGMLRKSFVPAEEIRAIRGASATQARLKASPSDHDRLQIAPSPRPLVQSHAR